MNTNTALFDGIAVFVGVVKSGSFTAAAAHLGHSTSFVSKEIKRLEARLGVRLLNRTTRTISLTDAGRAYFGRCEQIVIDAENAEQSIGELQETPRGLLRINAPSSIGMRYLCTLLPDFMRLYPELKLEVEYNDRMINVVEEGFDVVIRVGEALQDSSLVMRKLAGSRLVTVASPEYLAGHGRPQSPSDLEHHACIAYTLLNNPATWEFMLGGQKSRVQVMTRLLCNTAELQTAMAVNGVGIARLPYYYVERHIDDGTLELILNQYRQMELGIYAVYPHRQYLSAKVRAFVDFMVSRFQGE
ncbi:MAG: LysR family transcriptional regulator [Pseudomonadota bacterium]